jgi:hypothetical protein
MKSFKNLQSHRLCIEFPTPRRFAILHWETMVLTSEDVWLRGEETRRIRVADQPPGTP